jgi:hypothetical protein
MQATYTNQAGLTLTLRQRPPIFLSALNGTGDVSNSVVTFKAPDQDGAFYVTSSLEMMTLTLEGYIISATVEDTYQYRRELLHVFTPKQRGTLVYRGRQVETLVEEVEFIPSKVRTAPAFFISLLCPTPYWSSLTDRVSESAYWLPAFQFPLEITPAGIALGEKRLTNLVTVVNEGDVPCGMEIVFIAREAAETPTLANVATGTYLRVNHAMAVDDEIHILTHYTHKSVTLVSGGVTTDLFAALDPDSVFMQLQPGNNQFRYSSAAGEVSDLDVIVRYRPLWLGV